MKKFLCVLGLFASHTYGEEGMWPFNMIPTAQIEQKYGVQLSPEWAEHVQRSCLRISLGGSGSFVSSKGLVMTNHHVGSGAIYNLSTQESDYMEKGFYAATYEQEIKCPNMYVDQLVSIQDVTEKVSQGITDGMTAGERETARKTAIAKIESEAQTQTGLQPQVVVLYQGAKYNLYLYKRYSDVRLVMAPEKSIAFFGGDHDNFEYPRYDLDVCFFRVYDNGKPLETQDYLKWSKAGPKEKEPLFVAGHPGSTDRMLTSPHLKFLKDLVFPLYIEWISARKAALEAYAKQSEENSRQAEQALFSIDNSSKVLKGIVKGMDEQKIIEKKEAYEKQLYGDPEKFAPWVRLKKALDEAKTYYPTYLVLEAGGANYCKLYAWARHLVRLSTERSKPTEIRLKEYADTQLPTLELNLFSTEPVYLGLEKTNLTVSLKRLMKVLGAHHPAVKVALAGKTPEERAAELLKTTHLQDLSYRKELYDNPQEVANSSDPLIQLAIALDPFAREVRKQEEDNFESIEKESYTEIAQVIFKKYGESVYPDATFTLRLSIGTMKGYTQDHAIIEPITTFGGAFQHAAANNNVPPFQLPESWKKDLASSTTPFNFVSTNDIIGGNSGSPIFNAKGEVVGLIFDGNIQSLSWSYEYDDVQGRAVSVHSVGILEALEKIYGAKNLVNEINP